MLDWIVWNRSMMSWYRNIIRNPDINIFLTTNRYRTFLRQWYKMINLTEAFVIGSLHDFKDDIRFLRFGYLDCIKLFIVEINAIFVGFLAHLTAEFLPIEGDATLLFWHIKSFAEPGPQTLQVDVSHWTSTLTRGNQRISLNSRLKTNPAVVLVGSQNRLNLIFIQIGNVIGRS